MLDVLADFVAEALSLLLYVGGAGLLMLLGLLAEGSSLASLTAGNTLQGAWFAYMGALALYAGFHLFGSRVSLRA